MNAPDIGIEGGSSPAVLDLLKEARPRAARPLEGRERRSAIIVAATFLVAAVGLMLAAGGEHAIGAGPAVALVVAYALISRIEFDVGAGYAIPTQLVFVPMLFMLPPSIVPVLVAVAWLLGRLPEYATGKIHRSRAIVPIGNAWHSMGPALVFVLAGVDGVSWNDWPLYVGALAAQCAFDLGSSTMREWIGLGVRPRVHLSGLAWVYTVDALLSPIGLLAAVVAQDQPYAFALALPMALLLRMFAGEHQARIAQAIELSSAYRGTAMLLGDVVEADDEYTGLHAHGVVRLALSVADELDVDPATRLDVEFGALLHDVGKIRMPKAIVHKPGPLDDEEWAIMRTHTIEGERLLNRVGGVLGRVGAVVRASHERWDGGGYPDGLAGGQIPLVSRIISCCDAFNAMTTDRPYRSAMSVDQAAQELRAHAGTQFDPYVVGALLKALGPSHVAAPERVVPSAELAVCVR